VTYPILLVKFFDSKIMEEISFNATPYNLAFLLMWTAFLLRLPPFLFDTGIMEEISAKLVRKQKWNMIVFLTQPIQPAVCKGRENFVVSSYLKSPLTIFFIASG